MKGKDFPEDEKLEEEKRYQSLIKAIKGIKAPFSYKEKERIKNKVFSSLYPEKSLFYKRAFLSAALIFLFLLPTLAFFLSNQGKISNKPIAFTSKETPPKEKLLEKPFTLKPLPTPVGERLAEIKSESEEGEGSLAQPSEGSSVQTNEEESSLKEEDKESENQEGGGEINNLEDTNGGEEESPSPTPPPTPSNFTVLSGNLKDILSWEGSEEVSYRVYRASSVNGTYTLMAEVNEPNYEYELGEDDELGYRYYKVTAVKEGLESTPTEAKANEKVFAKEKVTPEEGGAIISSNGELSLLFPSQSLTEEVTVTIEENGIPHDTPNYTDTFLTSSYDFQPEGLAFINKPYLSLAYIPPVSEEQFEKDWLSKTAKVYYYDRDIGVWLDVSDNLSVDTEENYITSQISHFSSYAGGYTVMPHGRYSENTNLCEVCHQAHNAQGESMVRRENVDLCYYCHGAPTSTLPASGAHGENVQAEFVDSDDQSFSGQSTTETTTNTFSQSTQSEFNQDTFYHTETTSTGDGEVILSTFNTNPFSDDFNDGVVDSKWTGLDISAAPSGSENETETVGKLTVHAGGGNNGLKDGENKDNFRFTYQTTSTPTDFDMRVKIESLADQTGRDFAGLMIRDGTADNARYIAVGYSREGKVTTYYRTTAGSNSARQNGTINTFPVWVRIVKSGNTYYTYESSNGSSWNQIKSQNITINTFNFGLATSVGDVNNKLTTAVYDDFTVPTYDNYVYYTTGTVTSVEIEPDGNLYSWDILSWSENLNGGDITIDVLGYNGSAWDTLKTDLTTPSGENLSDIDVGTYTKLKLVGRLTRGGTTATPYLNSWQVSYTTYYVESPFDSRHPTPEREVVCADCHTPHRDPDDFPKLLFEWQPDGSRKYYKDETLSGGEVGSPRYVASSTIGNRFCWGCHGDWNNTNLNSTYYSQSGGDHKTGYENSAHWTGLPTSTWVPSATYDSTCGITDTSSTAINCLNCHLEHGSDSSNRLTGFRGVPKKEEALCYECHSTQQTEFQYTYHHAVNGEWAGKQGAAKVECSSCHNPHVVRDPDVTSDYMITDPDNTKNIWVKNAANNYLTGFCLTCHDANPPQATISASTIVPYTIAFPNTSQYPFFPGWDKSDYLNSEHWSSLPYPRKECTNCHDQHGTNYPRMLKAAEDDGTNPGNCLYDPNGNSCHVSGNSYGAPDIKTALQKTYKHPVLTYSGRHSDTETASSFNTSNRHAECVDCHNPHAAQSGSHTLSSNNIGNALKGATGVSVTYGGTAWTPPTFTKTQSITKEYELCFKCHSSWAWGDDPPDATDPGSYNYKQTDISREFNPNNLGYHPIIAPGKNQPDPSLNSTNWESGYGISGAWTRTGMSGTASDSVYVGLTNTFVPPYGASSLLTCTDCHNNDDPSGPQGPHGSTQKWFLKKVDTGITYTRKDGKVVSYSSSGGDINLNLGTNDPNNLCLNCHRADVYGYNKSKEIAKNNAENLSRFDHESGLSAERCNDGTKNVYGISCMLCHGGDALGNSDPPDASTNFLGGVHGSNLTQTFKGANSVGERLLNGASWEGHSRGSTSVKATCYTKDNKNAELTNCDAHSSGKAASTNNNYNY